MGTAAATPWVVNWLTIARLPFTTVAVVPFGVGIFLGYKSGLPVNWLTAVLGLLAVFSLCVTCYMLGEVYDQAEDLLTLRYGRTRFSGGTLLVPRGAIPAGTVVTAAGLLFFVAGILGLYISYVHANWLLFLLGALGALAAVFYSVPPVRLVKRGLGEIFIAICYGWLPLFIGFATATGKIMPHSYLVALPQALSIFNVILFNEFPDYESDVSAGKRNLVVQHGKEVAARLYGVAATLVASTTVLISLFFQAQSPALILFTVPVMFLSLSLAFRVAIQGKWRERRNLEPICGQGILLNHLAALTLAVIVRF